MTNAAVVVREARRRAGLSQRELARRAGVTQATISRIETGASDPSTGTVTALLEASRAQPADVTWSPVAIVGHRPVLVPDGLLPRLTPREAMRTVTLPRHVVWSGQPRTYDLSDRGERARCYELLLTEGTPTDVEGTVDPVLLVDLWEDLRLPPAVRDAWQPTVTRWTTGA